MICHITKFSIRQGLKYFSAFRVFNEESCMYLGTVDALEAVESWVTGYGIQDLEGGNVPSV